jgi:hypothetical protein
LLEWINKEIAYPHIVQKINVRKVVVEKETRKEKNDLINLRDL